MSIYFYFYEDELLYIGSTFDMEDRIKKHKEKYEKDVLPFYKQLKENGLRLEDLDLEEVKTEITGKQELRLLEGKCQRLYKPQCNQRIEGRSIKEWYKEYYDKDKEAIKSKKYRENNKEKEAARSKKYRDNNKDKIAEKAKDYYIKNREKILLRDREYRKNKKEKAIQSPSIKNDD